MNFALRLKARIPDDRKAVQQADRVGLPVKVDGRAGARTQTLSTEFIAEALTISDLFELNEVAAVELLLAGYSHSLCGLFTCVLLPTSTRLCFPSICLYFCPFRPNVCILCVFVSYCIVVVLL